MYNLAAVRPFEARQFDHPRRARAPLDDVAQGGNGKRHDHNNPRLVAARKREEVERIKRAAWINGTGGRTCRGSAGPASGPSMAWKQRREGLLANH